MVDTIAQAVDHTIDKLFEVITHHMGAGYRPSVNTANYEDFGGQPTIVLVPQILEILSGGGKYKSFDIQFKISIVEPYEEGTSYSRYLKALDVVNDMARNGKVSRYFTVLQIDDVMQTLHHAEQGSVFDFEVRGTIDF